MVGVPSGGHAAAAGQRAGQPLSGPDALAQATAFSQPREHLCVTFPQGAGRHDHDGSSDGQRAADGGRQCAPGLRGHPSGPGRAYTFTFTVHHISGATRGAGPQAILPCADRPGAQPDATCGAETVQCTLSVIKPLVSSVEFTILASASAGCTDEVATLVLHEELIHDGVTEDGNSDTTHGSPAAATGVSAKCAP